MLSTLAAVNQAGPLGLAVDAIVAWLLEHGQWFFGLVRLTVELLASLFESVLSLPPAWVLAPVIALIGWRRVGGGFSLFALLGLNLVLALGLWQPMIATLALVLASALLALLIGLPLGILSARYPMVWSVVRPGLDLMQTVGMVVNEAKLDRPAEICVDTIGLGSGVADRLREQGFNVKDVNVSESSAMNPNANKLRDELWMSAKDWLSTRSVKLPKDDMLRMELVAPRYNFTSSGKLVVESKDSMRKRGQRSPDLADAFCLTFAGNAAMVGGRASAWVPGRPLRRGIRGIV